MQAFKNYLSQFPNYTEQAFQDVLPFLSQKQITSGDHILEYDKTCKDIFFIEEGLFRLYYLNDGKEVTNCFCKENSITTSYTSLITKSPSDLAIQAIEDSKLTILPFEALQTLYVKSAFWQQVGRMVTESEYMISEYHIRFLKDLTATDRYLRILETDSQLLQRVPLNYLATYMQVSPETLSRIRKKISNLT